MWEKCLTKTLTREVHPRIVGCQGQMITFDSYFGLCLGQTLDNLTNILVKHLQSENLSTVCSHRLTLLARDTLVILVIMTSDENFQNYYYIIVKKAEEHPQKTEQPSVPRKRKFLNYSFCNT